MYYNQKSFLWPTTIIISEKKYSEKFDCPNMVCLACCLDSSVGRASAFILQIIVGLIPMLGQSNFSEYFFSLMI